MSNTADLQDNKNKIKLDGFTKEDIIVDDMVLVKKGTKITEEIARKLREVYMENPILIKTEKSFIKEFYKLDEKDIIKENESLKEAERNIKIYSNRLTNIFNTLNFTNKNNISDVTIFCKKILEELNSPRIMIKNILLNGSGEDSIFTHSVNVTLLSLLLGKWMNLNDTKLILLMRAAMLHDYGKYALNQELLLKKGNLTRKEIKIIKNHPIISYNLVKDMPYLKDDIKFGILMHHERIDGSGYPLGIKGNKIHSFAKIIAIADVFDAINSNRAYKKRTDPFTALKIIQEESIAKLDYSLCEIFINNISNYYIGEYIELSSGEIAKVVQMDLNNITKPLVLCKDGFKDLKKDTSLNINKIIINESNTK